MKKILCCFVLCVSQFAMAEKALHLFNWNDYIAEDTVTRFEEQCGCKVVQDYFSATEEMMAKLLAGAGDYD